MHHKDYRTLGAEKPEDVELLCVNCHQIADHKRAAEGRKRSANALDDARYYAARNTYMTKKYGEDWQLSQHDSEEFSEWLANRDGL